jgi:hypothetical protein
MKRFAVVAAAVVCGLIVTACSSSSTDGTGETAGRSSTPSSGSSSGGVGSFSLPPGSSSAGAPSSPAGNGAGSSNWINSTNFATAPHPDVDCAPAGLGGKVSVIKVVTADVTGDGKPEAIVRVQCAHSASEWPDSVYVYGQGPKLLGTLIQQKDDEYATDIKTSGQTVTLTESGWSEHAPGCCPDLTYTQVFTWSGASFAAGAKKAVLRPCGETAFDVSNSPVEGATGHSSVVLLFKNQLPQACTISGYPGLDALDASGKVLAHATRTLNGFAGGAKSIKTLTVAPGTTVSARLEWLNFDPKTSGACALSKSIATTPANTKDTVELPLSVSVCELQIHPTVAGSSGNSGS